MKFNNYIVYSLIGSTLGLSACLLGTIFSSFLLVALGWFVVVASFVYLIMRGRQ